MSSSSPSKVNIPLRVLQSFLSTTVLALCIYIQSSLNSQPRNTAQILFLLCISIFSILTSFHLALTPHIFPSATTPLATFLLLSLNALLYMVGFIAEVLHISNQKSCNETACYIAGVVFVFATLSYMAWMVEAIIAGMGMSRLEKGDDKVVEEGEESIVEEKGVSEKLGEIEEGRSNGFDDVQLGWA